MKKVFNKEEVMKELKQLDVVSMQLDGFYTHENENDMQSHTPLTALIYDNALAKNSDVIHGTDEDYLAQLFIEDGELKVEIARHDYEKYPNGTEYQEFEFKNVIESNLYEHDELARTLLYYG